MFEFLKRLLSPFRDVVEALPDAIETAVKDTVGIVAADTMISEALAQLQSDVEGMPPGVQRAAILATVENLRVAIQTARTENAKVGGSGSAG